MKKLIINFCTVAVVISFISCKKFLDEVPISSATDATFWRNASDANSGVAAGYALVRASLNNGGGLSFYEYGDFPTDEYNVPSGRLADIANFNWAVSTTDVNDNLFRLRRFDSFYDGIDQANRCLKFIPGIDDGKFPSVAIKNNLIGEAYFLRAFNYFYLTRVWGDVPLVTATEDPLKAQNLPRTKAADVLAQCIKDANMAISLLSWNYTNNADRVVRANKGAAYALLAHIYAWQGDYQNCSTTIDNIINQNFYAYVNRDNYLDIFNKGQSTEGIFEIAQNGTDEGQTGGISSLTLKAPYLTTNSGNALITINQAAFSTLFSDQTDKRLAAAFDFVGTTDPICIKYSNISYVNGQNTILPIKRNNLVIFRYSDIKLLKAEALAALGNVADAKTVLNEVRAQAGLAAYAGTDADLLNSIFDERGRELFLEGHRYYDLVRQAKKTGVLNFGISKMNASEFAAGKYYWPIDPSLIILNPKLTQTPYWADKL